MFCVSFFLQPLLFFPLQVTHSSHYEKFRCSKLQQMMTSVQPEAAPEVLERRAEATEDEESEVEELYSTSRVSRRGQDRRSFYGTGEEEEDWVRDMVRMEAAREELGRRRSSYLGQKKVESHAAFLSPCIPFIFVCFHFHIWALILIPSCGTSTSLLQ